MLARCYSEGSPNYRLYGARGITVCDRWRYGEGGKHGAQCFVDDMGERPAGKTLDRRDNNNGYSKANCWWATAIEQSLNRRAEKLSRETVAIIKSRFLQGERTSNLAREYGVTSSMIGSIRSGRSWSSVAPTNTTTAPPSTPRGETNK